jgi:phenylalanyl-tRNA synthetase beta chain
VVQQVDTGLLEVFDIQQDVYIAEIDAAVLECCFNPEVTYVPPSRFPVVQRDLSLILPPSVTVQSLVELVRSSDSLIRDVCVFDLFERTEKDGGERSVALSLEIADYKGTLQDEKISDILSKVGSNAESKLGAVIRQV